MSKAQPAAKFSDGLVKVTVWENTTKDGKIFYSFVPSQSYQDEGGAWQENSSFTGQDGLRAANLMQTAYNWSLAQKAAAKASS